MATGKKSKDAALEERARAVDLANELVDMLELYRKPSPDAPSPKERREVLKLFKESRRWVDAADASAVKRDDTHDFAYAFYSYMNAQELLKKALILLHHR